MTSENMKMLKTGQLLVSLLLLVSCLLSPLPVYPLDYGKIDFLHEFGSYGSENGQFKKPRALALDEVGDIYVADTGNHRVQVFTPEGIFRYSWGGRGNKPGQLDSPSGIAAGDKRIYVSDTGNDRIQIFDKEGNYIDSFGKRGDRPKEFKKPGNLVLWNDFLYVADRGNDRVQVFTKDGIFLFEIDPGKNKYWSLDEPHSLSVDKSGNLYILDREGKIVVFTPRGNLLRTQKLTGDAIWVSGDGIYIARKYRIFKYAFSLHQLMTSGTLGSAPGSFKEISAIGISIFKNLCVLDAEKNTVQIFLAETESDEPVQPEAPSSVAFVKDIPLAADTVLKKMNGTVFAYNDSENPALRREKKLSFQENEKDTFWAVDTAAHRLQKYDSKGTLLLTVGEKGSEDGQFSHPSDIALWGDILYVADSDNGRIQLLNLEGGYLSSFDRKSAGKSGFKKPVALAFDRKGNLYIADKDLSKIVKTDSSGNFIMEFGSEGAEDGSFRELKDIFIINEELYALDSGNNRVQVFNTSGEFLRKFGSRGNGKGEFQDPSSLYIDEDFNLYVSDGNNSRTQVLKLILTPSKPGIIRAEGMIREAKITWASNDELHVSHYRVLRKEKGRGSFETVGRVETVRGFSKYAYFDRDLESGKTYHYSIIAVSRTGNESVASEVMTAKTKRLVPSSPELIKAETGQHGLYIEWIPSPEQYTDHYVLLRNDENWQSFREIKKTRDSFIKETDLEPDTLYKYRVLAVGVEGDMSAPLEVEVMTQKLPAIEIKEIVMEDVFSNNYKYYESNPLGLLVLKNNSDTAFTELKISLKVQEYMDYPTEIIVAYLESGSAREIPLTAVFNNKVLDLTENTVLQSELSIFYQEGGEDKSVSASKPITIFEKHALIWDNVEKASIFITPKDPLLLELASGAVSGKTESPVNKSLLQAKAVFEELGALGITYIRDPNNPYQIGSKDVALIDYIQYPRETLQRKAGDCDDLVVLYSSLLESLGIDTALLTYPGHILLMFDTSLSGNEGEDFGFPPEEYAIYRGTIWIPVEMTLVGNSFSVAWKRGIDQFHEMKNYEMQIVLIEEAWKKFKPATLDYRDLSLDLNEQRETGNASAGKAEELLKQRVKYISSFFLNSPDTPYTLLQLGILYGENGMCEEAMEMFELYIKKFGEDATVMNNIGNLYFLQLKFAQAEKAYLKALLHDLEDPGIMINFARCYYKQGKKKKARQYLEKAVRIDPDIAKKYFYLASELRQ